MKIPTLFSLAVGTAVWILSTEARAALMDLVPVPGSPDFFVGFVNASYAYNAQAGEGDLTVSGYTSDYANGSRSLTDVGDFSLSARVSSSGVLLGGGFTLRGNVGNGDELLLSGALRPGPDSGAWGFQGAGDPNHDLFEFTYTVTGGENAAVLQDFAAWGAVGGIIFDANFGAGDSPFTGSWTSGFSSVNYNGVLDVFMPVPEPHTYWAAAALVLLAGGRLALRGCRKGRRVTTGGAQLGAKQDPV
jgi:hypothetical protein